MTIRSRFASLRRGEAALLLIILFFTIAVSCLPKTIFAPKAGAPASSSAEQAVAGDDLLLYKAIITRVAAGEDYYQAAAQEMRAGMYPLKPFVTVRLPTLAYVMAWLGPAASYALLLTLLGVTMWAYWWRFDGTFTDPKRRVTGALLIAAGASVVFHPQYVVVHEIWAGLLIALAAALRDSRRWYLAVLIGGAALMIRELVLPFVLLMAAFAIFERRSRVFTAWALIIILFAFFIFAHASFVATVVRPEDLSSQGWLHPGGWFGYLRSMRMTTALHVFPDWLANAGVILALFGWMSWRSAAGLFGTILLLGYAIMLMLIGRPENFYWGFLNAPLLLVSWVFLPQAFRDLGAILLRPKANWT